MDRCRVRSGAGLRRAKAVTYETYAGVGEVRATALQARERIQELRALITETYRILEISRETLSRGAETRPIAVSCNSPIR